VKLRHLGSWAVILALALPAWAGERTGAISGYVRNVSGTPQTVSYTHLGFAPKIFPRLRGAMALLNASRNLVDVIGSWSQCQVPAKEFEPIECWALRTGHTHLVAAGDLTARCAHALEVKNSYLCIPILAQGETQGLMHFQATDEEPELEPSELSFLSLIHIWPTPLARMPSTLAEPEYATVLGMVHYGQRARVARGFQGDRWGSRLKAMLVG